jgi:hypothetical protein
MGPFSRVYLQGLAAEHPRPDPSDVQTFSLPRISDHETAYLYIIGWAWIMCWRCVCVNSEVLGKVGSVKQARSGSRAWQRVWRLDRERRVYRGVTWNSGIPVYVRE